MLIRCEECGKNYTYEKYDGFCPKCGCYNNVSHEDAFRLEAEAEQHQEEAVRRMEGTGGLCDAQPKNTFLDGNYTPDCLEKEHDPAHKHTGGAYVQAREQKNAPAYTTTSGLSKEKTGSKSSPQPKGCLLPAIIGAVILIQVLGSLFGFLK